MADKRKQTAEEVAHLTLEHVKYIRGAADRIETDMHDLKSRVTNLEEGLAGVNRHLDRADFGASHISYHPLGAPSPGLGPGEGGRCRLSAIPSSNPHPLNNFSFSITPHLHTFCNATPPILYFP